MVTRLALLLTLPMLACGEDSGATDSAGGSSSGGPTSTGVAPTTGGTTDAGTSTSTGSDATGSATGTTTEAPTTGGSATSTTGGSTTGDTTEGVDPGSSSGEVGSTSTGADASTSTGTSTTDADGTTGTSTGEETGGDAPVPTGMCIANDLTTFVEPIPQAEELHIVSVYQPTGGAITVTIDRADIPLTLVLSSYVSTAFTLVVGPGVLLEQVILNGYEGHTVQGQGAASVTDLSGQFDYLAACGYFWPENDGGCDTPGLVAGAEALTGLTLASFAGCYEGSSFTLE